MTAGAADIRGMAARLRHPLRSPALARLRRRLADERGYSLIELVTVLGILATVLTALSALLVSGSGAQVEMNQRFQAQSQGRMALDKLRRDVHCARTVTPAGASNSVTLTFPASCLGTGGTTATWCRVVVTSTRAQLWRYAGSTCSGTGRLWADYVYLAAGATIFTYTAPTTTTLAKLRVLLPVNVRPGEGATYRIDDELVLRNSTRV